MKKTKTNKRKGLHYSYKKNWVLLPVSAYNEIIKMGIKNSNIVSY
jgi:hypothetical protein